MPFAFKLKGDGNAWSNNAVTNTLLVHWHPDLKTKGLHSFLTSDLHGIYSQEKWVTQSKSKLIL